jgi:hypothetical protein
VFRYSDNSDLFVWLLNSTAEQMRLTSTGLGIGTSSPTSKLTVAGAISVNTGAANLNALYLLSGNSGNRIGLSMGRTAQEAYIGIASTSNSIINGDVAGDLDILTTTGNIRFSTNAGASLQATLDSSGNLGLGVTPSAWGSGWVAEQLAGGGAAIATRSTNPEVYLTANAHFNGSNWIYKTSNPASYYAQDGSEHKWYRASSGTAGNAITFTQALTLNTNGALVLQGGDTAANGIGITFPATQSASSNANTLDDYEEGTWTPSLGGTATYTTQSGTYTKVGRVVTVLFELTVNTLGTGSTTTISGLPFANGITTPSGTPGATAYFASLATNVIALTCYAAASTTQILFNSMNASGTTATNNPAIFGNSARVQGSVTYFV